jgi:tetratricopeptide (TPR) repeat protein
MRVRLQIHAAALLSLAALCAGSAAAQIPDQFTNLKVLDKDIEKGQLIAIMRGWAGDLGVRCNHCHAGPDNLAGMDFASDEKATKLTARRMFEMARTINRELLADLPVVEEGAEHQKVACYTCHRGQAKPPRSIVVEVSEITQTAGVEAALTKFDELRTEFYGAGVYDFSERALVQAAGRLMESGRPGDAIKALEKNLEYFPASADSQAMIGMVHLESDDAEAAKSAFERALALDPENRQAQRGLAALASQAQPEGGPQP